MTQDQIPEKLRRQHEEHERLVSLFGHLARSPDAIIDVGVFRGTPWLYETFADLPFVLVDPQEGAEEMLAAKPKDFVFLNKAAGRAPGRLALNEKGAMSSLLERTALTSVPVRRRYEVDVVTLDSIVSRHLPQARRIGLKIDTEGFELEVLAGLEEHAGRLDFVVCEASVLNRFENSCNFSELVTELWKKGLRFYNVLNPSRPAAPRFYDCLFLPKDDAAFGG